MVNSKKIEMTLYYADWCGHCHTIKPEWKKLKENIKDKKNINKNVKIEINEYEHEYLSNIGGGKINGKEIDGYPTIKIKLINGKEENEYNFDNYGKERSANYMTSFIKNLSNFLADYKK
jgi:protein disulfide-isomerase A6